MTHVPSEVMATLAGAFTFSVVKVGLAPDAAAKLVREAISQAPSQWFAASACSSRVAEADHGDQVGGDDDFYMAEAKLVESPDATDLKVNDDQAEKFDIMSQCGDSFIAPEAWRLSQDGLGACGNGATLGPIQKESGRLSQTDGLGACGNGATLGHIQKETGVGTLDDGVRRKITGKQPANGTHTGWDASYCSDAGTGDLLDDGYQLDELSEATVGSGSTEDGLSVDGVEEIADDSGSVARSRDYDADSDLSDHERVGGDSVGYLIDAAFALPVPAPTCSPAPPPWPPDVVVIPASAVGKVACGVSNSRASLGPAPPVWKPGEEHDAPRPAEVTKTAIQAGDVQAALLACQRLKIVMDMQKGG